MDQQIEITVTLDQYTAEALAQFCKRSGFETFRQHAQSEHETYLMIDAVNNIARSLAKAGFAPR